MKHKKISISKFYCPDCNICMTIPRNIGKQREKNHKKTLWCIKCNDYKDMKEIREQDMCFNYYGEIL